MTKRRETKPGRVTGRGLALSALLLLWVPRGVRAEDAPPAAAEPTPAAKVEAERARLRSSDADDRKSAAWALGRLGPAAAAAAPDLVEALDDDVEQVRAAAFDAIRALGVPSAATVSEILARASRADPRYAALALWASVASGQRSGGDLRTVLLDPATREAARSALVLRGVAARDVWIALVKDGTWRLRARGLEGLATLGADAAPALDLILAGLDDVAVPVREAACAALGALVPTQDRAAARARTLLADPALAFLPRYRIVVGFTHRLPAPDADAVLRAELSDDPQRSDFDALASRALAASGARDDAVLDGLARDAAPTDAWSVPNRRSQFRDLPYDGGADRVTDLGVTVDPLEVLRGAGPKGVASVVRAKSTEPDRRAYVLAALGSEEARVALEALLEDRDARVSAAWCLVRHWGARASARSVEIALGNFSPWPFDPGERPWVRSHLDRETWVEWLAHTDAAALSSVWLARWDREQAGLEQRGDVGHFDPRFGGGEDLIVLLNALRGRAKPILDGLIDRLCSREWAASHRARWGLLESTGDLARVIVPLLEARRAATQDDAIRERIDEVLEPVRKSASK